MSWSDPPWLILKVATVPTVYGIETHNIDLIHFSYWSVATVPTIYGIETLHDRLDTVTAFKLQQYLPFTVCAEGCETTEEQSDDEVRTSQVPERSEGKTEVMR